MTTDNQTQHEPDESNDAAASAPTSSRDAANARDDTTSIDPRSDPPQTADDGTPILDFVDRDPGEDATTINGGNADR